MTNNVNELMKAAGVKPYKHTYFECKGGRSTISLCPQLGDPEKWCENECEEMQEKQEFLYPAFTPAKQLELIKLLVDMCKDIKISKFQDTYSIGAFEDWGDYIHNSGELKDFTETIAQITCTLIRFNELDKAEVKKILED